QVVALAVLVLDLTGSAGMLGAVLGLQAVPRTVLMLLGGVAADRFRPRPVLVGTSLVQAATVAAFAGALATGETETWQLYALALVTGAAYGFSVPAEQTIVADLLPPERLRNGVALN